MEYQYAFYPTLLDSYFRYKKGEDELSFNQLFDKINKVPQEVIDQEAEQNRLKGIAFEGLVNELINANKNKQHDLLKLDGDIYSFDGFEFSSSLANKVSDKLLHCTSQQHYKEKVIETPRGNVLLYGIFDYKFPEMTVDLKGVKSYNYGKYKENMQHKFASLITGDKQFNYVVTDYEYMFIENYWLTDKVRKQAVKDVVEFIDFIEHFKKYITDTKIFGNG